MTKNKNYRVHKTRSNGCSKDDAESHGQRSAHVQELVAGSCGGHSGKATHHAGRVPGCTGEDGPAQEADWSNDSAKNHAVADPK